jgi:uncharacterized membrane protein SirB2
MIYYTIKNLHVAFVVMSISGFVLRSVWMLMGSPLLQHRVTRALPHVIDTLLLLTALVAAAMISQYPFVAGWVTAKVLGLLAYIVLGTIALKRGRTMTVRILAVVGALATYAWIASVAVTKDPAGFLPI